MTTALPAMKGKFGSTEFYIVTMQAKEFAERVVIPKELDEWDDMTLEERYQREVDYNRVKKHIAPYLANDPDRFFGAFIIDIRNHENVTFEPISDILKGLPTLYRQAASMFGFLYLQGGEVMVPLDGQHRLAALKFAISGKDEKSQPIDGLSPNFDVATDTCTVIMIRHDSKKARKIFNKVNRYAKPTSKADDLITADDDIVAVIVREEIVKLIGERIVNHNSNSLSKNAIEFTTLATVYESSVNILEHEFQKIDKTVLPSLADQKNYRAELVRFWESMMDGIKIFSAATHDVGEEGDLKRQEIRGSFVLGKPIAQAALVDALLRLRTPGPDGSRPTMQSLCERLNDVDWRVDNSLWQNILMRGDRVVTGRQAMKFAGRFIAYYVGASLSEKELEVLRDQYSSFFPAGSDIRLPEPLTK